MIPAMILLAFAAVTIPLLWWLTTRADLPKGKRRRIGWGTRIAWLLIVGGLAAMVVWSMFLEPIPGW